MFGKPAGEQLWHLPDLHCAVPNMLQPDTPDKIVVIGKVMSWSYKFSWRGFREPP